MTRIRWIGVAILLTGFLCAAPAAAQFGILTKSPNADHPGSCLAIHNQNDQKVTVRVTHPDKYKALSFVLTPGEQVTLTDAQGHHFTSDDGTWSVFVTSSYELMWQWQADLSNAECKGTWILTPNKT